MATFTTKLGLRKPAGTDLVTVTTDLNASMDLLDTAVDRICTSSTRPSTPFVGMKAFETDTTRQIACVQITPSVVWRYTDGVQVVASTSEIVLPFSGQLVFNTTDGLLYRYYNAAWGKLQSDIPACTLYMNTTKTHANSTDTDVIWDGQLENWTSPAGTKMWDDGAQPARIYIRKDGYYLYGVALQYAANATGKRTCTITLNGIGTPTALTAIGYDTMQGTTAVSPNVLQVTRGRRFVAGDILRCNTWQNSGGNLQIIGNTIEGAMYFWAAWQKP